MIYVGLDIRRKRFMVLATHAKKKVVCNKEAHYNKHLVLRVDHSCC